MVTDSNTNKMAAAPSNAYIFSTLAKFSEGNGAELSSFLSKFERCCLIGNKVDVENNPVKGQLLMLFVEGRASAKSMSKHKVEISYPMHS